MSVLRFNNVSKEYDLQSGRETLATAFRSLIGSYHQQSPFYALQGVSFEVGKGEAVGIIGLNGSGKSTILKLAAGITHPTSGIIEHNGKISGLLELGAGFNPDMTGRENIFLNASLFGIPKNIVENKFNDILEFSELKEFIDVPVKRYSSGMYARLGFSVAAHIDAAILLIDEAIAVGDIFFQQKCYHHMRELLEKGTAILLATHDLISVRQFCSKCITLHHGAVHFYGDSGEGVSQFQLLVQSERKEYSYSVVSSKPIRVASKKAGVNTPEYYWPNKKESLDIKSAVQTSDGLARCTQVALCDSNGKACGVFEQGQSASFFYEIEILEDINVPSGGLAIHDRTGIIFHARHSVQYGICNPRNVKAGTMLRFRHELSLDLACGEYTFDFGIMSLPEEPLCSDGLAVDEFLSSYIMILLVSRIGSFQIIPRKEKKPLQIKFFGISMLQGNCMVAWFNDKENGVIDSRHVNQKNIGS